MKKLTTISDIGSVKIGIDGQFTLDVLTVMVTVIRLLSSATKVSISRKIMPFGLPSVATT